MSVGIDLLEIERMEQALDRRPSLALRLQAWSPRDIEVVGEGAQTRVALHGPLAALGVHVDISLTHSKVTAGAVALVR